MAKSTSPRSNYDAAWKRGLLKYLPDFFAFFFPHFYRCVDWSHQPTFLDRELEALAPAQSTRGKRSVDTLVELVWHGQPTLVLVHIEIQAQKIDGFERRVYLYNARIDELYGRPVTSLVILADRSNTWRPCRYETDFAGTRTFFEFPSVKLNDLSADIARLERSKNPFALLTAATLHAQASVAGTQDRLDRKMGLIDNLRKSGMPRWQVVEILILVDHVMKLTREQEKLVKETIARMDQEMPIMRMEREFIEQGVRQGVLEGYERVARRMLEAGYPQAEVLRITGVDPNKLNELKSQASDAGVP